MLTWSGSFQEAGCGWNGSTKEYTPLSSEQLLFAWDVLSLLGKLIRLCYATRCVCDDDIRGFAGSLLKIQMIQDGNLNLNS